MKKLVLLRHAKSSWDFGSLSDHDRPLNDRGYRDAPLMGRFLASSGFEPNYVISSTANRAMTTAKLVTEYLQYDFTTTMLDRRVYHAAMSDLYGIIREIPDDVENCLLIGHNPTFTDIANDLTGDQLDNLPTAGVYGVELPLDTWVKVRAGVGNRFLFKTPKLLVEEKSSA